MEVHGGADIHLQPMEDPTLEQVDMPKGGCDPVASSCWNRPLEGPVEWWKEEPTQEQVPGRACDLMGDPHWSSLFLKDCTLWKGSALEQFMKKDSCWRSSWRTVSCGRDPTLEQENNMRSPLHEEEGAAETMCNDDEMTKSPIPHPSVPLVGEEVEKSGVKMSSGKSEG
ncbi:hypothetical protein AV530_016553 [Patagioenas fasciata monilis]|uniref:Uncharacterized protein n=1 Tax=Patagioenas fasciata monilis TaxID=372326 RepID=A0A1V4J2M6_PATFA|nr:hypothetical protein AV530_016553 [Patagioenas fasciata monilis]